MLYTLDSVPAPLYVLIHFITTALYWGLPLSCPFTGEESEAQRGYYLPEVTQLQSGESSVCTSTRVSEPGHLGHFGLGKSLLGEGGLFCASGGCLAASRGASTLPTVETT